MQLPFVLIPLIVIVVNDFIKFIIQSIKNKKLDISWMFHPWWMPSWHSSLASSVITVVFLEKTSLWIEFMIAVIFWIIIMYDARWIRREASKHAMVLNTLQKKFSLEECLWHTSLEVFTWALVWAILSYFLWSTGAFWN